MSGVTPSDDSKESQSSSPTGFRYFIGGRDVTDEVVRTSLPGIEIYEDGTVVEIAPPESDDDRSDS